MSFEDSFTIIIPSRDFDQLTKTCVEEIRTYYPKVKISLVLDIVPKEDDIQASIIKAKSKNIAAKRNQAASLAKTEYLAFIDSDAYPEKGWLENAYDFFKNNEKIGIFGGPNLSYDRGNFNQLVPYTASKSLFVAREPNPQAPHCQVETIASSNMFISRELYEKVGGMNETLFTGEDIDLCYKVLKHAPNFFVKACAVHHKQRGFMGHLKQRFVWGRGILNVFRQTMPHYSISLVPFFFVIGGLGLFILNQKFFLFAMFGYLGACLVDSLRVAKSPFLAIKIYPIVILSQPAMGLGALYSLVAGDINNNYKNYNNQD